MRTNTFIKALAFAMLLATACNKSEIANDENTEKKGFALPVTVNVTHEGDDATKATYNESTKKLEFSAGDKLFVKGNDYSAGGAGFFAGTLTWQSGGTFSGTILTENTYSGTIDALFTAGSALATLLPANYGNYPYLSFDDEGTYSASVNYDATKTFATSKATAVEQFSFEVGGYTSGTGFALHPANAILNFTITGLAANTGVDVALSDGVSFTISGSVTTNASGTATFAIGVYGYTGLNEFSLTVGGNPITLVSSSKVLAAGKIYNITRVANAINGKFSVGAEKKVYFSKGNLRYVSGTWSFFDHQYDFYNTYSADAWDKFGWSTSSTTYGMSTSEIETGYSGSFVDWGTVSGIGEGWYTLSHDEWIYLFNDRSDAANKYGWATVNDVHGIIILPDAFVDPNKNNGSNAFEGSTTKGWNVNVYTAENWAPMEAAGAVFLPAAGWRSGDSAMNNGIGYYWSSTTGGEDGPYGVYFDSDKLEADYNDNRRWGQSVRLVRQVK